MSRAIFKEDGAPAHRAMAQDWWRGNFLDFRENGTWPGKSPDLSPIENLWAIVKEEGNKMGATTSEKIVIQNVQVAWRRIKAVTLGNLMSGLLERMRECVRLHGGYIGKQILSRSYFASVLVTAKQPLINFGTP